MSTAPDKRKALGKGLSALLPARPAAPAAHSITQTPAPPAGHPAEIPIEQIRPNPNQPRTNFDSEPLEELAQSIRANGIIQPLIVRRAGQHYEIVAGERRWRAASLAGMKAVPALIQDVTDDRLLEIALIENIQREDLNPLEAAHAFDRLNRELGLTHDEIGRRTGKDRSSIANLIRLLKLPPAVQQLVAERRLAMGQARAILAINDYDKQIQAAEHAVQHALSTRQVEALVRYVTDHGDLPGRQGHGAAAKPDPRPLDPNVKAAVTDLERTLGTRVRIVEQTEQRGRIEIEYYSQDELNRLYTMIVGEEKS